MTTTRKITSLLAASLLLSVTATAQVTPITPGAFGPATITETFEGVLGVTLPQELINGTTQTVNWGAVPTGFSFPTGVRLTAQSPSPDRVAVYDFVIPSSQTFPFPLGSNGAVGAGTQLPSGAAFLAIPQWVHFQPARFRLPTLASKVGFFVEAAGGSGPTITVYDEAGVMLGSHTLPSTDGVISNGLDTFLGVESTVPIRSVSIDAGQGALDDLMFDPCAGLTAPYGQGCPGTGNHVPALAMGGCPQPGGQISLEVSNGLGGSTALLLFGLGQGSTPVGASGCDLLVTPLIGPTLALPLTPGGPGQGSIFLPGTLPAGSAGVTFTMQAWVIDPVPLTGAAASNGLQVSIN